MEKTIKKAAKKAAAVMLALIMAIAFMPVLSQEAHAGGGSCVDLDKIIHMKEANDEESTTPKNYYGGATLSVSMSDLESQMPGFKSHYDGGHAEVDFVVYDNSSFANPQVLSTSYYGGAFSAKLKGEHVGKYCALTTGDDYDTGYNNNSTPKKILKNAYIKSGPEFSTTYYTSAVKPLKRKFTFTMYGSFVYYYFDKYEASTIDSKIIKLYRNGKKVKQKTTSKSEVTFTGVPVSYKKKDNFKVRMFVKIGTQEIGGPAITFKAKSVQVGKNKVYATKLSKNKAIVRWSGAAYANKYRIYKGSRLLKTVKKSARKIVVSKKGAGTARYRVVPIYKSGSRVCKGTSTRTKPKKNQVTFNRSTSYTSASYGECPFVVTKISLKGSTYTVTGYALNNRIFDMYKYKKLYLKLSVGGKKAFSKTYRNKIVKVKESSSKRIILKIKGKKGMDLKYGGFTSLTISETPYWTWHGRHIQ